MAVFRIEKNKNYTVMSNYHLKDKRLSLKAKGLLSQMLSLPEDWDYTLEGLATINKESKDAIRTAIQELERFGYIQRRQTTDSKGKFSSNEYIIHELPSPSLENPTTEKPMSENPTQLNTKILNTKDIKYHIYQGNVDKCVDNSVERTLKESIDYNTLVIDYGYDQIDQMIDLILGVLCSNKEKIRVDRSDYPAEFVKDRFRKLNSDHIRYVIHCLNNNKSMIRNIKSYLLTALFNAPATMESYYTAAANYHEGG